ncbi:unnamed protein product [Cuscuta campestris]|uniref:Uncharacterized protein n=1 Tax=Cuscuta campestris TaxID=132261 RepID=A0A484M3P5_9ASTE|nr:unnamed protein product [Cuscuta campestris]
MFNKQVMLPMMVMKILMDMTVLKRYVFLMWFAYDLPQIGLEGEIVVGPAHFHLGSIFLCGGPIIGKFFLYFVD